MRSWVFGGVGAGITLTSWVASGLFDPWDESLGCLLWLLILPGAILSVAGFWSGAQARARGAMAWNAAVFLLAAYVSIPWDLLDR